MSEIILNLGYEIETGINRKCFDLDYNDYSNFNQFLKDKNFKHTTDGSIHLKDNQNNTPLEFNSNVYKDIKNINDLNPIFEDFKILKGFIKEVNASCGFHIHLSFKNISDYYTLLNYDFANKFIKAYEEKFKGEEEIKRLSNNYCKGYENKKDFNKITRFQLRYNTKCSSRYKAVNYNSFNLYKTIEFRIFPSTKSLDKFKEYVTFLYDFVTDYIKKDKNFNKDIVVLINKKTLDKTTDYKKEFNTIEEEDIINMNDNRGFDF
jgi:hypothetical protein